jgi:aerobic C4-dicarboxylate transport protein
VRDHEGALGAFGAMAFTIGKYGVGSLVSLAKLMGTFYLTCLVFVWSCWPSPAFTADTQVHPLHQGGILIVLGTSSSESVLPRMIRMENLGIKRRSAWSFPPAIPSIWTALRSI